MSDQNTRYFSYQGTWSTCTTTSPVVAAILRFRGWGEISKHDFEHITAINELAKSDTIEQLDQSLQNLIELKGDRIVNAINLSEAIEEITLSEHPRKVSK